MHEQRDQIIGILRKYLVEMAKLDDSCPWREVLRGKILGTEKILGEVFGMTEFEIQLKLKL